MVMEWRGNGAQPQATLVDILDKVLDKGLVVAGDIRVSLANVELLTIKIRLLVCSIDKAAEIGMDWWRRDDFLASPADGEAAALRARIDALERQLAAFAPLIPAEAPIEAPRPRRSQPRQGRRGGSS